MAELIPEKLPSKASVGEKRVFAILEKLPDDCIVYYEPVINNRHPDFVVLHPSIGVLIIEVKGWYEPRIVGANTTEVIIKVGDREEAQKHPLRQARDYMFRLKDEARRHLDASTLLETFGRRQGQFRIPFGHMVVLSNIRREQIASLPPALFPATKVATRDELDLFEDLPPQQLAPALQDYFDPWWRFPALSNEEMSLLRAVIHPEIVIERAVSPRQTLKLLDLRQERHALSIGHGHRIIHGVAGSGKTVLLIARAKLTAGDLSKKVLLLCYNRGLADYLTVVLGSKPNVIVKTFHAWGWRNGVNFRADEAVDEFGKRLLRKLEDGEGDARSFDCVLIDEAQDFPQSWFECSRLALKEPDDGDLLIVGDWGQSLYRRRSFTWAAAGIRARGRTINTRFDFDRNYRNTREILQIAAPFVVTPNPQHGEDQQALFVTVDTDAAARTGPMPRLISAANRRGECRSAYTTVRNWLQHGLPASDHAQEMVAPSEIAVLYPRLEKHLTETMIEFADALGKVVPVNWPKGEKVAPNLRDAVDIRTIHSAKGLQWRAVVILWADLLPTSSKPDRVRLDRGLLYVGMTRAEDVLVLTNSKGSPFTVEIEGRL